MGNKNANLMSAQELNARLTPEERKKNASKAGKASSESRRLNTALEEILSARVTGDQHNDLLDKMGVSKTKRNHAKLVIARIVFDAENGSAPAQRMVLDMQGATTEKIEISTKDESIREMERYFANKKSGAGSDLE